MVPNQMELQFDEMELKELSCVEMNCIELAHFRIKVRILYQKYLTCVCHQVFTFFIFLVSNYRRLRILTENAKKVFALGRCDIEALAMCRILVNAIESVLLPTNLESEQNQQRSKAHYVLMTVISVNPGLAALNQSKIELHELMLFAFLTSPPPPSTSYNSLNPRRERPF